MSTILRALKKVEEENAVQQAGSASIHAFNARQAVNRTMRVAWRRGRIMRWSVVLLILVSGGALVLLRFYSNGGETIESTWTGISTPRHTSEPALELPAALEPDPSDADVNIDTVEAEQAPKVVPAEPATSAPLPETVISKPSPAVASAPSSYPRHPRARNKDNLPTENATPPPKQAAKETAASPAFKDAERLTDGRLKVQAIAWAPAAEDRMAVINNRILHEGESVEGFTIVTIAEDQILLSGEGRRWMLVFGRH